MAKSGNSRDKKLPAEEIELLKKLIEEHRKLLTAIGKL